MQRGAQDPPPLAHVLALLRVGQGVGGWGVRGFVLGSGVQVFRVRRNVQHSARDPPFLGHDFVLGSGLRASGVQLFRVRQGVRVG